MAERPRKEIKKKSLAGEVTANLISGVQEQAHGHVQEYDHVNDNVNILNQFEVEEKKEVRLPVQMPASLKTRFKKIADKKGVSMSEIVRTLVEKFVEDIENIENK